MRILTYMFCFWEWKILRSPFIADSRAIIMSIRASKKKKAIWIHYWNMTINYQFPCNIFQLRRRIREWEWMMIASNDNKSKKRDGKSSKNLWEVTDGEDGVNWRRSQVDLIEFQSWIRPEWKNKIFQPTISRLKSFHATISSLSMDSILSHFEMPTEKGKLYFFIIFL